MTYKADLPGRISSLAQYAPGLSINEIQEKYNLTSVIKMASNENPLGCSPLVQEVIAKSASLAFRYPQGGNPRLARALAQKHGTDVSRIVIGNGSDEIIDLVIRILCEPGIHSIACFDPCFSIYPIQAQINGIRTHRVPLNEDFSHNFGRLMDSIDENTRICFITTPDNPSGYCPPREKILEFAKDLAVRHPGCLLLIDEAYMDFAPDEKGLSLLACGEFLPNAAFIRTFSKSYGLAGLRIGYGIFPETPASCYWRARLPFSLNVLAEEAALAAISDAPFREATLAAVREGRSQLAAGLEKLGCHVYPSAANFIMFSLPPNSPEAGCVFEKLLQRGIIIRQLKSYGLPRHLRVSVGNKNENHTFLCAMEELL